MNPLRVAVLLSGSGRTLANFLARRNDGQLPIEVVAVASNRPDVRGLQIAADAAVPSRVFLRADHETAADRDAAMLAWIHEHTPDVIALAGYLALLRLAAAREVPILNIHPALLPAYGGKGFYGDRVHRAVLEAGEKTSGATVHLVDDEYDRGPIVAQREVEVRPGDTPDALARRVFAAECELYPDVLRAIAEGRLSVRGGRVAGSI